MNKYLPLIFKENHIEFQGRIKNHLPLQISALVPEILHFENCAKYANEMTDDVVHRPLAG